MTENTNTPAPLPGWNEAYNQPLAQPKKPGETPHGMEAYVNAARLRLLQIKDPALYQRYVRAKINHTPLSEEDSLVIFGSSGVAVL